MKKVLVFVMVVVIAISFAFAQDEIDTKKMDWGARLGTPVGVGARLFLSEGTQIEAIIGVSNVSIINVTALYEWSKPLNIGNIEGLSWFFGGGLHVGFIGIPILNLGIDGIVGIEYDLEVLTSLPITLSLDYKPALNLLGSVTSDLGDAALTVHFDF